MTLFVRDNTGFQSSFEDWLSDVDGILQDMAGGGWTGYTDMDNLYNNFWLMEWNPMDAAVELI